jgi:hypothetical protein
MKFICAQPAIDYYTWQVEVMINNFIRNGVNPEDIHIVCAYKKDLKTVSENWIKLKEHYTKVNFFFYRDDRVKPSYIPSIRPHILHQHWVANPYLEKETVFYHDCDIVLTKPLDLTDILEDQNCYVSDTVSYIGANYIRSKGEHYLDLMTQIVNVNKDLVISQEKESGGAQYLLKNIPTVFWNKVYYDCENLWRLINNQIGKDKPDHPIQIWCADMWAVLWNLWVFNNMVKVTDKMSFAWATSSIKDWEKNPIYHNAGVVGPDQKMFYKGQYQVKLPYSIKLEDFSDDRCSYKYAEEILKTKEVTCLK